MIYLIKSAAFKDKANLKCNEFEILLKIGYTEDSKSKSRFFSYTVGNPTHQVICKIPNGTEDDEKSLHLYFKKYIKYGKEWFIESEEIYKFFEEYNTIEKIREKIPLSKRKINIKESTVVLWPILSSIEKITGKIDLSICKECDFNSLENVFKWIKHNYIEHSDKIINYFCSRKDNITDKMMVQVKYLRESTDSNISERFRYFCKSSDFSKDEKSLIAWYSSSIFNSLYNEVGEENCSLLSYNVNDILKEFKNYKYIKESLSDIIGPGKMFSNEELEIILRLTYDDLLYKEIIHCLDYPSISYKDITKYFNVEEIKVVSSVTNELVDGVKIIGIK